MLSLLLLLACGGTTKPSPQDDSRGPADSGAAVDAPTWHQDVAPIFSRSCDGCHSPEGFAAPTWADGEEAAFLSPLIKLAVEGGVMPPWYADGDCNSYKGDFSLTDEEVALIVAWAEADGPLGDPTEAATLPPAFEAASLARVDVTLSPASPYTPTASPDDYRCFVMDWPYEADTWVTGFEVQPDNIDLVHHVIGFVMPSGDADAYRALDAAAEGEGYPCYGGPGGDVTSLISARWLGVWTPGSGALNLPEGRGLRVSAGSVVVFQAHYNTVTAMGQSDQSSLLFQVEEERQGWADVQPWTEVAWVLGVGMDIPAGSQGVTHTFEYTADASFNFNSASLHMHKLGQSGRLEVEHPDGSVDCVLSQSIYDFDWQRTFSLIEPVSVTPGDVVRLSCTWDNPSDEDVSWGDGTGDEMCLGITSLTD